MVDGLGTLKLRVTVTGAPAARWNVSPNVVKVPARLAEGWSRETLTPRPRTSAYARDVACCANDFLQIRIDRIACPRPCTIDTPGVA